MIETCPTFLMDGPRLVDVCYTDWEQTRSEPGNERWELVGGAELTPSGDATHIVVELPIGCFSHQIDISADDLVTIQPGGSDLERCVRPRMITEART